MISNHILTEDVLLVYLCAGILSTKFKDKKLTGNRRRNNLTNHKSRLFKIQYRC